MPIDDSGAFIADVPPAPPTDPNATAKTTYGVAGMGFSLLGGLLKGMAQIQAGGYNADLARQNAHLAELAAGDAVARGQFAASQALIRGSQLEGQQKAAYVGAGVSTSSGSAVDVMSDTKTASALDALMLTNNAAREAWGYKTQATQFREKATIDESTASNEAGADILGSAVGAAGYASKMIGIV